MRRHTMTIGHNTFVLTDDSRAHDVETATLLAIRQGGGMVNVFHDDTRNVSVLVSPGVPIFFSSDSIEEDDEDATAWVELDVAFQDFDF